PDAKAALFDPFTAIHRDGASLAGRKYHDAFAPFTTAAADALRKAADLSPDTAFARFLRLRADALLSDDYYASDVAWVELKNPVAAVFSGPLHTLPGSLPGEKVFCGGGGKTRQPPGRRNPRLSPAGGPRDRGGPPFSPRRPPRWARPRAAEGGDGHAV